MCNVKGHASMQSGRLFALYGKACHANQKKGGAKPAVNVRENASWFSSFLRTCLFSGFQKLMLVVVVNNNYLRQPTFSPKILGLAMNHQQTSQGQSHVFFSTILFYSKSYSILLT